MEVQSYRSCVCWLQQAPDAMVTAENLEMLPALDLFPEPSGGYFRTGDDKSDQKSPEVLKVNFAEEPPSWDSLLSERAESPPVQPGYYLQKVYKKPMSVSTPIHYNYFRTLTSHYLYLEIIAH